jgi:hypothetical protein
MSQGQSVTDVSGPDNRRMVPAEGLEPPTPRLQIRCSLWGTAGGIQFGSASMKPRVNTLRSISNPARGAIQGRP